MVRLDVFFHLVGAFDAVLEDVGPRAVLTRRGDSFRVLVHLTVALLAAAADTGTAARTVSPSTSV